MGLRGVLQVSHRERAMLNGNERGIRYMRTPRKLPIKGATSREIRNENIGAEAARYVASVRIGIVWLASDGLTIGQSVSGYKGDSVLMLGSLPKAGSISKVHWGGS